MQIMKYPPITYELLKSKNAFDWQLVNFKNIFGSTVSINLENATKVLNTIGQHWTAENLLDSDDFKEYEKYISETVKEFIEIRTEAYDKFLKWHPKIGADKAMEEYNKVAAPAYKKWEKICTTSFVNFTQDNNMDFLELPSSAQDIMIRSFGEETGEEFDDSNPKHIDWMYENMDIGLSIFSDHNYFEDR